MTITASPTKPLVAIVGRPNTGKSTLFNRLTGQRTAIVSDIPGTTRDRVTTEAEWAERVFILVDTGGLDREAGFDLWDSVKAQIDVAVSEADVIVMMVDSSVGVTPADEDVAHMLRQVDTPVVMAANKSDNDGREADSVEFYRLGLGDPTPISAYHNTGIDDLMTRVLSYFSPDETSFTPEAGLKLAIVGRTNAGKSQLLNAISGEERAIVSDIPGTTRDSLDSMVEYDGGSILLIDTAGIRRRGKIDPGIERFSAMRSLKAIDRADVALLLLDATELATAQDTHIASYVLDAYRGIVVAVNKWDLAPSLGLDIEKATNEIRMRFKFARFVPITFISALKEKGIPELLDTARRVYDQWSNELPRYDLRRTVLNAVASSPPKPNGRRLLKVYGVTQDKTSPPSFTFYVNSSEMVHFSYRRYLENELRKVYGFEGSPLRMRFKGRGEEK